ncbi:MAG: methyltransferase domain-containing protein [Methanomicrobiales archaeon]|nr:methyltransferase domain-containing protein [Methanomicrobiales archaeon]
MVTGPVDIDEIYRRMPLGRIPWNSETPPDALVELVRTGRVRPSRTIDLGCGAGTYAVWLAGQGFDVTGVDSSPTAIGIAREKAEKAGVSCRFVVADLLGDLHEIDGKFDFGYDWELLHHIMPGDRVPYARNVASLLNPGAIYFSVCFSEEDPQFGGTGKIRRTPIGTVLYFSSESEIRELFSPYFSIEDVRTITVPGKFGSHRAVYLLAERR